MTTACVVVVVPKRPGCGVDVWLWVTGDTGGASAAAVVVPNKTFWEPPGGATTVATEREGVGAIGPVVAIAVATGVGSPMPVSIVPSTTETDIGTGAKGAGLFFKNCCLGASHGGEELAKWLGEVREAWCKTSEHAVPKRTLDGGWTGTEEGWRTTGVAGVEALDLCCVFTTARNSWAANSNSRRCPNFLMPKLAMSDSDSVKSTAPLIACACSASTRSVGTVENLMSQVTTSSSSQVSMLFANRHVLGLLLRAVPGTETFASEASTAGPSLAVEPAREATQEAEAVADAMASARVILSTAFCPLSDALG